MDKPSVGRISPAYVAGLLDGEGCISILRVHTSASVTGWKYQLQITVVMRESWIMEDLRRVYGGSVWRQPARRVGTSPVSRWRIGDQKAIVFLDSVLPYLRAKGVQALIAKHFMTYKGHQYRQVPLARQIQEDCFWAQRYENRRGVGKVAA